MNIALEKTEEFVNGQSRKVYGDAFVRGNNGRCIFFKKKKILDPGLIPALIITRSHVHFI